MAYSFKNIKRADGSITYQIAQIDRIPGTNKFTTKVVEKFNSNELLKEGVKDIDSYAKEHLKAWKEKKAEEKASSNVFLNTNISLSSVIDENGSYNAKINLGYAAYSKIYHELGLNNLINARRQHVNVKANLNTILQHHLYSRLLWPSSKMEAYENRSRFYGDKDYSIDSFYRSLDYFLSWRKDILKLLDKKIKEQYGRKNSILYYDVTNYYFERDNETELLARGKSKENRPEPIVQMGLFMDELGLPITYDLYRGNTHDSETFKDALDNSIINFKDRRKIIVADKGMFGFKNILKIRNDKNGYVISQSIRKSDEETKSFALSEDGWTSIYNSNGELVFKTKERIIPRKVSAESEVDTKRHSGSFNERQVFIWSKKYAERAKQDREVAILKAKDYAGLKSKDAKDSSYGKLKYVKKTPIKDNKEVEVDSFTVEFDEDKLIEDETLDGYYIIGTNVVGLMEGQKKRKDKDSDYCYYSNDGFLVFNKVVSAQDILNIYSNLWKIEETFKLTKTEILNTRPVYHNLETRIRAHFLICFIALTMERLLEFRLNWELGAKRIQNVLKNFDACYIQKTDLYLITFYKKEIEIILGKLGLTIGNVFLTQEEIRKFIAKTKKVKTEFIS